MTKKDYELIIEILADQSCELMTAGVYESLARAFTYKLALDNPKFNRDMFLTACGIEV
mgnify:FL=1